MSDNYTQVESYDALKERAGGEKKDKEKENLVKIANALANIPGAKVYEVKKGVSKQIK